MSRSSHQAGQYSAAKANPLLPAQGRTIEALAGQNSVSKIPSKETWHGKGFRQLGAGKKKLTTDHSGKNLYEGSHHQIRRTASSSSSSSSSSISSILICT